VVGVCWRHTTMSYGTWVCFLWASGVNVRTLGGRVVVRRIRGGLCFVSGGARRGTVVSGVVHDVFVKRVARKPYRELSSNDGKLRLVVRTVCCSCGSIDMGELCSDGER
jgi:hypothetical protein